MAGPWESSLAAHLVRVNRLLARGFRVWGFTGGAPMAQGLDILVVRWLLLLLLSIVETSRTLLL